MGRSETRKSNDFDLRRRRRAKGRKTGRTGRRQVAPVCLRRMDQVALRRFQAKHPLYEDYVRYQSWMVYLTKDLFLVLFFSVLPPFFRHFFFLKWFLSHAVLNLLVTSPV